MKFLVSRNENPLIHISSGQLLNRDQFVHQRRRLDTFVIIICTRGSLYIVQDGIRHTVGENQYIILFADHEHYGYRPSGGVLSYYWCHFEIARDDYHLADFDEISAIFSRSEAPALVGEQPGEDHYSRFYLIPEYGDIAPNGRTIIIFRQLLDLARSNYYSPNPANYALSLLAMEITQENIEKKGLISSGKKPNPNMEYVIEWIRINYNRPLSMKKLARNFNYNPDYLSTVFRKYMGMPLMRYITMFRITRAKMYLLNSKESVKEIAYKVGFRDEKSFMKRFKQLEDTTPSTYRNAFRRTKIVK
jgi:AraC-like DNA-binding protein